MRKAHVYPIFDKRALVTRDDAHALQGDIDDCSVDKELLVLDLEGILSMTPGFLDQLLLMVERSLPRERGSVKLVMLNSPPGFRNRMESIGRVQKLDVISDAQGDWLVPDDSPTP